MRVIAIDHGEEKGKLCKEIGAEEYIDFQSVKDLAAEVKRITTYGAHGVVVTASTKEAYESAPSLLRPGGTMVVVGLPHDATVFAGAQPLTMALNRLNVVGSVTGTLKDVEEALDFTARGLVRVSEDHEGCFDPGLTINFPLPANFDQRYPGRTRQVHGTDGGWRDSGTSGPGSGPLVSASGQISLKSMGFLPSSEL